ncbi:MAG TPA: decaprenyl-phosphate phosphoribosyltransferase [Streptosporangiaceae bacterium]|jgi:decaprenyl-phosphate phosphoribosyltransferase|nr:decaprenyl-phosphate phosphoribosyltransferase [Streptosporangiaceae bacterium]
MTTRSPETDSSQQPQAEARAAAWPLALAGLIVAAVQAARPRQWPKNLLVFTAPLAGATLGRADGFGYALVAFAAFTAASSAVYLVNDVMDAQRDRLHPTKRLRPIASGRLPRRVAIGLAIALLGVALLASLAIGEPRLAGVISAYVTMSLLYSLGLKHVPGAELLVVAFGFVLRAIGGAVATHVPPSAWFLTVCSLGALMVAIGKRYTELSVLGDEAAAHRPVMRWYRPWMLRAGQRGAMIVMLVAYVLWALAEPDAWMRGWHLASAAPLAAALFRFDRLTGLADGRPVEDLITRDPTMICCELTWLTTFTIGL